MVKRNGDNLRALTEAERRQLLDAADYLPVTGGRSKDRRRHGKRAATERPQRQGYRPWRNRAILYTLVETGMRRAEVTSIDLADVDFQRHTVRIIQKGGQQRRCQVSQEGMQATEDYIEQERAGDAAKWIASPALFLPAATVAKSSGRLAPVNVNTIMAAVYKLAGIAGRTPHSARHGMGYLSLRRPVTPARYSASSAIPTPRLRCSICSLLRRSSRPCWMSAKGRREKGGLGFTLPGA